MLIIVQRDVRVRSSEKTSLQSGQNGKIWVKMGSKMGNFWEANRKFIFGYF